MFPLSLVFMKSLKHCSFRSAGFQKPSHQDPHCWKYMLATGMLVVNTIKKWKGVWYIKIFSTTRVIVTLSLWAQASRLGCNKIKKVFIYISQLNQIVWVLKSILNTFNSLPPWEIFHAFLLSADFFQNHFFLKNSFRNTIWVSCLFDLIPYVPSTVFKLNRDMSSWVEQVLS